MRLPVAGGVAVAVGSGGVVAVAVGGAGVVAVAVGGAGVVAVAGAVGDGWVSSLELSLPHATTNKTQSATAIVADLICARAPAGLLVWRLLSLVFISVPLALLPVRQRKAAFLTRHSEQSMLG